MQSKSRLCDYEIQTKLGSGSYGVIYRVVKKVDRRVYVLKQVNLGNMKEKMRRNSINEAQILSKLKSPFIVRYLDSFLDQNQLNIIMEYCEGGDLALLLKQQTGRPLKQDKIWKIFLQILIGLEYIHSKRILHRDIKTLNIFLTKDQTVKIGDLGVAKLLNDHADFAQTMVGTPFYLSPELCQQKPYNDKSDMWALGCLLYEMCTYRHPFEAANQGSLILKIVRGRYTPISENYSKDLRETVDSCLERDYKRRPTASVLLSRPALKQKCEQLGLHQLVEKHTSEEEKNAFAEKLSQELNRREGKGAATGSAPQQKPNIPKPEKIAEKPAEKVMDRPEKVLDRPQEKVMDKPPLPAKPPLAKIIDDVKKQNKKDDPKNVVNKRVGSAFSKKEQPQKVEIKPNQLERQEALLRKQAEQRRLDELRKSEERKKAQSKQQPPKPVVQKVKYERQISAKVYDRKAANSYKELHANERKHAATPAPLATPKIQYDVPSVPKIKSKGFSNDPVNYSSNGQAGSQQRIAPEIYQTPKVSDKKVQSQKRFIQHSQSTNSQPTPGPIQAPKPRIQFVKKRMSEPKVLFGVNPQLPPAPPLPRVRKGAPSEKSRNSQHPVTKPIISEQQRRLVANLPDSDSSSDEEKMMEKQKSNRSGMQFKLKEVDDQEVLRRYEELVEGRKEDTTEATEREPEGDFHVAEDEEHEQPADEQLEQGVKIWRRAVQQIEDHEEFEPNVYEQTPETIEPAEETEQPEFTFQIAPDEQEEQQLQYPQEEEQHVEPMQSQPQKNQQWNFDDQPELPEFQQANMYLMEPEPEQNEQETRNYLQAKLSENMKREDELNQLMQLKIDQCKKAFKSNYEQVIAFFRKKINMDSEYSEQDQLQVEQFLKSKKLTDARKFQNIYKIMHFEMELQNCRNIIQGICKKLSILDS